MLEKILIKYFDLEENYNDYKWNKAYNKLISLIYYLGELGVISDTNKIVDELDKIDSEDY